MAQILNVSLRENRVLIVLRTLTLGVVILLLAACGGGGGGGSSSSSTGDTSGPMGNAGSGLLTQSAFSGAPAAASATQQVISEVTPAQVVATGPALRQLLDASSSTTFGSVFQTFESSSVSPVTGVDTTFTGERFVLNLNREDGTTTTLDSDQHDTLLATIYGPSGNPITSRPGVDAAVYDLSADYLAATGVAIEWSNTDYTDYIAGGYWVYVDFTGSGLSGAELGAFIDGPDYRDRTSMPTTGTATYTGIAAGVYVASYGSDVPVTPDDQPAPGSVGAGDYRGQARLVADFANGMVSGQINNISLDGVIVTPTGAMHSVNDIQPGFMIHLDAINIAQNGRASGSGVRVTHPNASVLDITTSSGDWANRFSYTDDSSGNHPRAIAGTHAGKFGTSGDTDFVFTGAHYGASERFE